MRGRDLSEEEQNPGFEDFASTCACDLHNSSLPCLLGRSDQSGSKPCYPLLVREAYSTLYYFALKPPQASCPEPSAEPVELFSWLANTLHYDLTGGKVKKWSVITDCLQVRGNALQRVGPSLALPHGTAPALLFHCSACFTSEDMTALALAGLPPCSTD
ncbi:hypothetical protein CYMTET_53633 [Cymbomonas tetramitiformis]|uniref:Uncharacterized protein n=1 Tax=Cymbomonas tetramitiformis TaxID=36881 RepID=A0AAE0BIC2_9CHLO|nr:hypothetical protein CYMTET_53633 [Cymbomonas tetramitiformis]